MIYAASLDELARRITLGITLLFAAIVAIQFLTVHNNSLIIPILSVGFFTAILFIAYALRPVNYELTDGALIINRPIKAVTFLRSHMMHVELIDAKSFNNVVRTFGVGGLFGYFGKFYNRQYGKMTWYATQRNNFVLITTDNDDKIVITPDEPHKFVADFYKRF